MRQGLAFPARSFRSFNGVSNASSNNERLSFVDCLLVAVLVIPIFGTFFPIFTYISSSASISTSSGGEVGRDATVVMAFILLTVFWLFAKQWERAIGAFRRNWILLIFIAWVMASSRWVELPGVSFNRAGRMLVFALYGIYLVEMLESKRRLKVLFYAFLIALIMSLLAIIALPSLARSMDGRGIFGTWRGATSHKNSLGTIAGISLMYAVAVWKTGYISHLKCAALAFTAVVLLALANSVTSLIATMVISGLLIYLFSIERIIRDRIISIGAGAMLAIILGLMLTNAGDVMQLFGRDSGLTGRDQVWQFAELMIAQKPFWGWGHGVWSMPIFSEMALSALGWPCPHAHNFWIDLRLQLGLPGLLLAVVISGLSILRLTRVVAVLPLTAFAFPLGLLIFLGFRSYSETIMLDVAVGDTFWVSLMFAWFAKLVHEHSSSKPKATQVWQARTRRFGAEARLVQRP